jgi:hypothetical protein
MKQNARLLIIFISVISFTGCATLTGYQDGKTLPEGMTELNVSLNVGQSQPFDVDEDNVLDEFNRFFFPNIEVSARRSVANRLDAMVRLSTSFNIGAGLKYQISGDHQSRFAMSLGAEIQNFGLLTVGLWNVQIPLYTSIHPRENLAFYFTPRYIYQFSVYGGREGWNYLGGNAGLMTGRKHKLAIDFGYYRLGAAKVSSVGLLTVGVGGKFVFGG